MNDHHDHPPFTTTLRDLHIKYGVPGMYYRYLDNELLPEERALMESFQLNLLERIERWAVIRALQKIVEALPKL